MRREAGFTLVELLVVMLLGGLVLTALLGMVFSAQKLYHVDTARVSVNQDVSVALTAITNEGREAGERMTRDSPALLVTGDVTARTLILRRSLLDVVLPVCKDIKSGTATDVVFISQPGKGGGKGKDDDDDDKDDKYPEGCKESSTEVSFETWKAYRIAQGGSVNAYIYNPKTGQGENFEYDSEDNSGQHIHRGRGKWEEDYPMKDNPRVYIMEQLTYSLKDGLLYLAKDSGEAQPFLPNVVSFEVYPYVANATGVLTKTIVDFPTTGQSWKDVSRLEIKITGKAQMGGRAVQRSFSSSFTPRNVFSADQ